MGEEITKIIVGGCPVGIVGLKEIFQLPQEEKDLQEVEMWKCGNGKISPLSSAEEINKLLAGFLPSS